ncbi:hypothetical protein MKJ01_16170 [Chryseobacterium sp. SSA4.19]|uniref:hypothetical protein n=1 Tax=Chryseobacterium sp. SSA4.19 TaxID=2919915 RepID=UPI001F4E36C1|nr:hypothetical protein [Chryseobacterium sp. SSA4.19]MCJ8155302.1 hypothetical protein [Chryseobacterium sp. SSA4.19]
MYFERAWQPVSGFVRFWQPITGQLHPFFGSASGILRYFFGKKMFFPKKYRRNTGEDPENIDFLIGISVREIQI